MEHTVAGAAEIMKQFAENTGLTGNATPRRYLWTDAFAVCNFLELKTRTGDDKYLDLALRLVDQVHRVLGRHRDDDSRSGWISGLAEEEGAAHPTAGGLRIGKTLPERRPDEAGDRQLEWDRDGQYFHYLTKWMQALHQVARKTGEETYDRWARELARAAHESFTYQLDPAFPKRMYWKMSIDLAYPQVSSMGHHDPLDGYITYLELQAAAPGELRRETAEMENICRGRDWITDDPLGIGGLLCDSLRLARLVAAGTEVQGGLLEEMLSSAAEGVRRYVRQNPSSQPVEYRLAFRELGLAIGLHAPAFIEKYLRDLPKRFGAADVAAVALERLAAHRDLATDIIDFWLAAENQSGAGWASHRDINMAMLATSLLPQGFLGE